MNNSLIMELLIGMISDFIYTIILHSISFLNLKIHKKRKECSINNFPYFSSTFIQLK